ncbi:MULTISPECIES: class I SAM-dependent methyltransferase [Paraburkholderia]|uniref:class I SAM-dependent methyltransferase n=1 Tax=Paraburkholderia TaxID=1822464 RepID=UPI002250C561|nr:MULTISPECIES: class I SAM-dependent methyltransferase [Paraburkholderia]MCX4162794.1 class I SAM-dependent methyltransferase [Paraburkholderia megapolitana]MDN7158289.1 class I SAM-dependent methyltransferase [Paraburkholderia sp. CHISQ3]MDQ6495336.1 class I SAM-dependent methyltransferase [Paraburkholderia megapolitana]
MRAAPEARAEELKAAAWALAQRRREPVQRIVELGAGSGYATPTLSNQLAVHGELVACDPSPYMLDHLQVLPGMRKLVATPSHIDLPDSSVDLVFSMASFHHVQNKAVAFDEIRRVLKESGELLLVDVEFGTSAQRFFDHVVQRYCRTGHEVDFLDRHFVELLAERSGLHVGWTECVETDWQFDDEPSALAYIARLFGLEISTEKLRSHVQRWLRPVLHKDGRVTVPWSLGCYLLYKSTI